MRGSGVVLLLVVAVVVGVAEVWGAGPRRRPLPDFPPPKPGPSPSFLHKRSNLAPNASNPVAGPSEAPEESPGEPTEAPEGSQAPANASAPVAPPVRAPKAAPVSPPVKAPVAAPEAPPESPEAPPVDPPAEVPPALCHPCPPGTRSNPECLGSVVYNSSDYLCYPGECPVASLCTSCLPGQINRVRNATQCTSCPVGTFSPPISNFTSCPICPARYFCVVDPVVNATFLTACGAGYFCPAGSVEPRPCAQGSFCQNGDQVECKPGTCCPARSINPNPCQAGFFCPKNCTEGVKCPLLFNSLEFAKEAEDCSPTFGFWAVIVLSAAIFVALAIWIWIQTTQRLKKQQLEQKRIDEVQALIPEPEGPKYQGL